MQLDDVHAALLALDDAVAGVDCGVVVVVVLLDRVAGAHGENEEKNAGLVGD